MTTEPAVVTEGSVSDADLDAAANMDDAVTLAAQPDVVAPDAVEPASTTDPEPSAEPHVADEWKDGIDKRQRKMEGHIGTILSTLQDLKTPAPAQQPSEDQFEYPASKDELDDYFDRRYNRNQQAAVDAHKNYEQGYISTVTSLEAGAGLSKEDVEGVKAELFSEKFNVRHSDNATADASRNYASAVTAYFQKKTASPLQKENPVKGETPSGPLGGATSQTVTPRTHSSVKLDEHAQDFVNYTGMEDEKITKTLDKPMPSYLGGK